MEKLAVKPLKGSRKTLLFAKFIYLFQTLVDDGDSHSGCIKISGYMHDAQDIQVEMTLLPFIFYFYFFNQGL